MSEHGENRMMVDFAVDAGDPSVNGPKIDIQACHSGMSVLDGISYLTRLFFRGKGGMPIFILLAQDRLAYRTVIDWAEKAERAGVHTKKVSGAWTAAEAMIVWARKIGSTKLPD